MPIPDTRKPLPLKEIYAARYSASDIDFETFKELMIHVSQELGIPAELLRPDDRFDRELSPTPENRWDSGIAILIFDLKDAAKRKNLPIDRYMDTLDDYLRMMHARY